MVESASCLVLCGQHSFYMQQVFVQIVGNLIAIDIICILVALRGKFPYSTEPKYLNPVSASLSGVALEAVVHGRMMFWYGQILSGDLQSN